MSWPKAPPITDHVAEKCRALVFATARKYDIPPVLITAHWRGQVPDEARKEVMRVMIADFGLRRYQVAAMFGRDLRRVRRSVLGV